jgi:hypothetical protein
MDVSSLFGNSHQTKYIGMGEVGKLCFTFYIWTGVFGIGFWAFLVLLLVEYQIDVFW